MEMSITNSTNADVTRSNIVHDGIAIGMHAFYLDTFEDIICHIERIHSIQVSLYVTCPEENVNPVHTRLNASGLNFKLFPVVNRGRDILPFLKILPEIINDGHRLLIKVHTKKSPHRIDGQTWLKDLIGAILTDSAIEKATDQFAKNPGLGVLAAEDHIVPMGHYFLLNSSKVIDLSGKLGIDLAAMNKLFFAAGTMFMARTAAFAPLLRLSLGEDDFEDETGVLDGTMAHALERVLSVSAYASGYFLAGINTIGEMVLPPSYDYEEWQRTRISKLLSERDGHIAGLDQAVAERDGHIANLTQAVAERDGHIAGLTQAVAERDGHIANLTQAVAERDGQIARIHNSMSWRITRPLRMIKAHIRHFAHAVGFGTRVPHVYDIPLDQSLPLAVSASKPELFHPTLSRFQMICGSLNLKGRGMEIGPSYNPVLPKKEGYSTVIVDHMSADDLRAKYKAWNVDTSAIEEVDIIWKGVAFSEAFDKQDRFDYIVASHVIEHIPDPIRFFQECEKILNPNGKISLVVPDKRYCFDYYRPLTTTGEWVEAYLEKHTVHPPRKHFDHFAYAVTKGGLIAWGKGAVGKIALQDHTPADALSHAEKQHLSSEYQDVHGWQFTPETFCLVLKELQALGLIKFSICTSHPTHGFEFYITLDRLPEDTPVALSKVDRQALVQASLNPFPMEY